MIRLCQRLCCIPSTDVLTAEDRPMFVNKQEGFDPNTQTRATHSVRNDTTRSKLSSNLVTPQDSSTSTRLNEGTEHSEPVIQSLPTNSGPVQQSVDTTLQDAHHSNTSENTRIVPIDQHNVNSRGTEFIDLKLHSDQPTPQVATQAEFQSLPSSSQVIEQGIGATFQDAHHFTISGDPRFVTIGQQVNNNRGSTYGLDTLEKFVSFSALHDSSAQDPERCCHPNTRKSVLGQICNWADDPTKTERILWLHGPAGVGKSAIAQTISYLYGRDKVGATFFFFRSDSNRNDGNRLLPTLAWQLASSVTTVKDLITISLEEYPDLLRKTVEIQFDQLIAQPFITICGKSATQTSTRVIIIDGLDECSDVKLQRRILKIIGSAVADARFPLRFFISSRPEAHIEDFFVQFKHPILEIDLANVDDEAYRDIKTYLTSEFARIAVEQELDPEVWPGQDIVEILVSQSSGQFVYTTTVIKYVGDEYESAVARLNVILGLKPWTGKSPFADLDALYTEILKRQPDQDFLREFLPILVARSLLVGIEDRNLDDAMLLDLDEKELHRKLRGMHSILKIEPFLDIHHKSFLDFLDNPSRSGEYHVSKHFANKRYMQLITDELVKAASRAINQPHSHENDHFKPRFSTVTKRYPFPIEIPVDDLEEILRPLQLIQEKLLQLPNMSVPWKAGACDECWTFYMIDDLLLHLACFRGAIQLQVPKYVGIRSLTAAEEKQRIPQLDLDDCLSLLLADLRGAESHLLLNVDAIGLMRALVHFDPTEAAMKVRSMTDAQNLVELIFCLNKNRCFQSWFGATAHNATRLALAIYGRVPLLPRSLFLDSVDVDITKRTYKGNGVDIWYGSDCVQQECFDVFIWGNLFHGNMGPFLGLVSSGSSLLSNILRISLSLENGTVHKWRQISNPSISKIQQIIFQVANAIQHVHSLDIVLNSYFVEYEEGVYIDSDNHATMRCPSFLPSCLSDRQLAYDRYGANFTLEGNICSFGFLFFRVLFNFPDELTIKIRPKEPEIPDKVWHLIQWCCAEDPKERPTIDQVIREMESWLSLDQFTLPS